MSLKDVVWRETMGIGQGFIPTFPVPLLTWLMPPMTIQKHLTLAMTTVDQTLVSTWPLPAWLFTLAIVGAIAFVVWVYRTERGNSGSPMRWTLAALRSSLFLLILWMLMGWSWQRAKIELPELVIAVDVSESMLTGDGVTKSDREESEFARAIHRRERAQQLISLNDKQWQSLRERYQLRAYLIGQDAALVENPMDITHLNDVIEMAGEKQFTQQSRLGESLIRVIDGQAGRGTAAIVFISDGITTSGRSLVEAGQRARRSGIPVHSISVGHRLAQPDLRIGDTLVEPQVYLGDQVSLEATILSSDIDQALARVQLIESPSGHVLDEQSITLTQSNTQATVTLRFVPKQPGQVDLRVAVQPLPGETDTTNNQTDLRLHVRDRVIRVMLVFGQPSYEFRFLKHFLERARQQQDTASGTFELVSILQSGDPEYVQQDTTARRLVTSNPNELSEIDVFIFGPMDPNLIPPSAQQTIVRAVTHGGAGSIFVDASGDPVRRFGSVPLGVLLPIERVTRPSTSMLGLELEPTKIGQSILPSQTGQTDRNRPQSLDNLPLLQSLLAVDSIKPGAQILAHAIDRSKVTRTPLIVSQFAGAGRTCFIGTDETYRWTTAYGEDQYHQQFWGQLLRWISRGKLNSLDESELTVEPKHAQLGSPVRFELRLPLGEELPIQASLRIEGSSGFQQALTLQRAAGNVTTYQAVTDQLATGNYRAAVVQPALSAPPSVQFSITAPPAEQASLRADEQSMRRLAELSRGKAYHADENPRWWEDLPPGRSVRIGSLPMQPIWNQHWVAALFVGLITIEWLLRRRARML